MRVRSKKSFNLLQSRKSVWVGMCWRQRWLPTVSFAFAQTHINLTGKHAITLLSVSEHNNMVRYMDVIDRVLCWCICVCACVRACVHASNESKPGIDVADAVKDKKERKCWRMIRQKRWRLKQKELGEETPPPKKLIEHKAQYEKSRQESEQKMKKGRTE